MNLDELRQFLVDCIKKQVIFPRNRMTFLISDYYESIPEQHHDKENLEFRVCVLQEMALVFIKPLTPKK